MKPISYLSLCFALLVISSCKKDPKTSPVNFTSTTYQNLEPYDNTGKPDNLSIDTLSTGLISFINGILVKGHNLTISHPELFTSTASADINITSPSIVFTSFISGDAAFSNSLAFYTYPTNNPPTSAKDIQLITYILPNAGRLNSLQAGDKIELGRFDAGITIGFVLMENAWDTTKHMLNNNAVHFCATDALNPETNPQLKRHAVLLNYMPENKLIIGFEDTDRSNPNCDNDFDDLVFYNTIVPQ